MTVLFAVKIKHNRKKKRLLLHRITAKYLYTRKRSGSTRSDTTNMFTQRPSSASLNVFVVFVSYLLSLRTVTFDEVLTHFSFSGHVDMAVRAVAVVTDSFQEVGTHRHLREDKQKVKMRR